MINSQDVNEEELQVLRGDAIGDNLCSEKWIITTLMSLYEMSKPEDFTEDLESRLCTLWDLSMEETVVVYMESHDFLSIAKHLLETCDQPRLIEMVLGIIGNMCCNNNVITTIRRDKNLVAQILSHLKSDDAPTLIQLLRIVQSCTWQIQTKSELDWVAYFAECNFGDSIVFILNSSTNDDLLAAAIKILSSMSQIDLSNENTNLLRRLFKMEDLIPALLESFMQRKAAEESNHSNSDLEFIENWLSILTSGIDDLLKPKDLNEENTSKMVEIMYIILKPYEESYNLIPVQQSTCDILFGVVDVLLKLHECDIHISPKVDHIIVCIVFALETGFSDIKRREFDLENLSTCLSRYLLQIVKLRTSEYTRDILHLCKHEIRKFIMSHMQSHPDLTPAIRDKIKETDVFKNV